MEEHTVELSACPKCGQGGELIRCLEDRCDRDIGGMAVAMAIVIGAACLLGWGIAYAGFSLLN